MTDLRAIKTFIVNTIQDEEVASSARHEVEAYGRLWPYVVMVNDWDVWNESRGTLRLQVIRWLEELRARYDFYHSGSGLGLVGFQDQEAAAHFKLRWSGERRLATASKSDWNPHPLKSAFEAESTREIPAQERYPRRAAR